MLIKDKRTPAYTHDDRMPFGKHKDIRLMHVPAAYFAWLWEQRPLSDKKLENYIWNSKEALEEELGREI